MNDLVERTDPDSVNTTLSKNVRQLRAHRGLTLDELASCAGLSKGMLVQIEQARTNPSIGTLCKLANALGVTIARLIDEPAQQSVRKTSRAQLSNRWTGPAGSSAKLLAGIDGANLIEFWDWELQPGHCHISVPHPPGTNELVYVLKGSLTVVVGGRNYSAKAHEALQMPGDQNHQYRNNTRSKTHFFMVVIEPGVFSE